MKVGKVKMPRWVFGLLTLLDSVANRSAPIVAVEAKFSVKNPPTSTAATVHTVRSGFGIIFTGLEFRRVDFSNSWRAWSQFHEAKAKFPGGPLCS